jgi:hypothetical protein
VISYSAAAASPRGHRSGCAPHFPGKADAGRHRLGQLNADPESLRVQRPLGQPLTPRDAEALRRADEGARAIGGAP